MEGKQSGEWSLQEMRSSFQRLTCSVPAENQTDTEDAAKESNCGSLPLELLRDMLVKIEREESMWPERRHVVACAGVCKGWREIIKELVKVPEESGSLTFPISVKQPGPRDFLIQCFIKRDSETQIYRLYLGLTEALTDEGKFLLAARKCRQSTCADFLISLDEEDVSREDGPLIGKLRSNFLGTKFTLYEAQPHAEDKILRTISTRPISSKQVSPSVPIGNHPIAHIAYELNVLGSRGPRRMNIVMNSIPLSATRPGGVAPTQTEFVLGSADSFSSIPFFRTKSPNVENLSGEEEMLVLKNKTPRWHEELQCWCLNFRGRVTEASVKNFQLVAATENDSGDSENANVRLQFGKVAKDLFTMDYQYPLSAFQAFAICLSSFDTKIACE